jgi:hypothetical protein
MAQELTDGHRSSSDLPPDLPPDRPSDLPPDRPSAAFLVMAAAVIAAALIVRLAALGRQSYWIDELFSVNESAGGVGTMLKIGSTEVHTPFYAALLLVWMRIGGTAATWTRLLSTLCLVASVAVSYQGLRGIRLNGHVRWALTAATAANGVSIVYSLETRSYALLLLGSVGLTVTTLRAALDTVCDQVVRRLTYLCWLGWSLLAATAHLFGAILTLGAVAVLIAVGLRRGSRSGRMRRALTWPALAAVGCSLQAGWLLHGLGTPGFAAGTNWLWAPGAQDVWDLVTSTFSSGGLTRHRDGFAWTSPVGAGLAAALCLAAAGYGYLARRRAAGPPPTTGTGRPAPLDSPAAAGPAASEPGTVEAPAAAVLIALLAIVAVAAFGISQWKHLWSLRNMVVITPAMLWAVICLAAWVTGSAAGRRWVATAAIVLLGVSLVPTALDLSRPYKNDFRGLFDYLIAVREREPAATFVFFGSGPPRQWQPASGRSADDPVWQTLYSNVVVYPSSMPLATLAPIPGVIVVTFYRGVTDPNLDAETSTVVTRLGAQSCRRVPIYGLGVVECH